MEQSIDQPMTDGEDADSRLPLSSDELKVLDLYDKLQELRLEIAIINAQSTWKADARSSSDEELQNAQNGLLEARAKYRLRNDAIESVMVANPILKAVHSGTQASPIERDLLPFVESRDEMAISVVSKATEAGKLREDLTKIHVDTIRVCRENVDLTAELFQLAEQVEQKKAGHIEDPETQRELDRLNDEVKAGRRRWRVMKGVASGVVAGSGVDWARDGELRDIVLDPETED